MIYQNYHCHKDYTNPRISDSAARIRDYAERAAALGHGILSSLEHGWQGNYYECWKTAKKYDLKLLIGAEAYWVKDRTEKDNTNAHICLLAKNEEGRRALNDALSEANLTGFYGRPRVDIPLLLSLPRDDLWVTTACVAYWQYPDIDDITRRLADHFGSNFFLEVQAHNTDKQVMLNQHILELHAKTGIPLVMGCDSHYILEEDAQIRSDFLLSKGMNYPDEEGWYMDYPDGETVYERFARQGVLTHSQIVEAMENTNRFLAVEEYDGHIFDSTIKMPTMYPGWTQEEKDREYRRVVQAGWDAYKIQISSAKIPLYEDEIEKEVRVVETTGMADYFLINHSVIKKGIENGGVLTTTGRGSAVSWITNKLLGFTEVDRIAASVKMYPDRFMSAARILQSGSLPDIDYNVADAEPFARAQKEILGDDHAYPMLAYGTMKKSKAWKLYAKSQGIPFEVANEVSNQIKKYENALKHAEDDERDTVDPLDYIDPKYHDVYQGSSSYLELIDSWSIAPCSYLLYSGSIRREIGLVRIKDNICCLMDGHWAEECHFLKNDLLTVKTVDLTDRIYKRIGIKKHTVPELLAACPPTDPCWDMYRVGATCCLNQVGQPGTSARVGKYHPTNISELCAFIAAIRPGFKSMYKTFEERRPFSYGVKAFDDLIQTEEMPYSFVLYQEMEMAALHFAGIPIDECYTAIKNIAKKRADKVLAYKEKFLSGFREAILREGKNEEEAEALAQKLWQIVEDSAAYSFNACVTGDTRIQRADGICPTVEDLYSVQPEQYGEALSLFPDGSVRPNIIIDVREAGVRQVYQVLTSSGSYVDCTGNHKFPTPNGIKRCDQLREGDMLYVFARETGEVRCGHISSIIPLGEAMTYDVEMAAPAHTFVIDNGLVVSNSHSYCVALDSLYGAWLKAHYPLEFYEVCLSVYDQKGDKDKLSELKEEAERYFKIQFPPFRFRQDNRRYLAMPEKNQIVNKHSSIKGVGSSACALLYQCGKAEHDGFFSVLAWLDKKSFKSAKVIPLIKIGYFQEFGNTTQLLRLTQIWDWLGQGTSKQIRKDKLAGDMLELVKAHATDRNAKGTELKTYTITDMTGLLRDIEHTVLHVYDLREVDYRVMAQNQLDILGYVDMTTGKPEDRRKLFIRECYAIENRWGRSGGVWKYKVNTMSIGSGRTASLTLDPKLYSAKPVKAGDIILCTRDPYKDEKGYWHLIDYEYI